MRDIETGIRGNHLRLGIRTKNLLTLDQQQQKQRLAEMVDMSSIAHVAQKTVDEETLTAATVLQSFPGQW